MIALKMFLLIVHSRNLFVLVTKSWYKKVMFDPNKGVMMIAMFEARPDWGVSAAAYRISTTRH